MSTYTRASVNDVRIGDVIQCKDGELFTVARISTPEWETLAFHSEDDEIWYSEAAYVEILRPDCASCSGPIEADGSSLTECAAGRYGDEGTCDDCGGCICDGAC